MTYELRTADLWPDADYELRAASDGFEFDGYAAVFDKLSKPMRFPGVGGGRRFQERISQGAFTDTLASKPDVALRFQHKLDTLPLARTSAGTMTLQQDTVGLRVHAVLPDNEWGRPIRDSIARGDLRGMSFSFTESRDSWAQDAGMRVRTLHSVTLGPEVSVADGRLVAYGDTSAMVRAVVDALEANPDEVIAELRDAIGEGRLTGEQHAAIVSLLNEHSEAVVPVAAVQKLNSMRDRLDAIRG